MLTTCRWCGAELGFHGRGWFERASRCDREFCDDEHRYLYHNTKRKLARKRAKLKALKVEIFELEQLLQYDLGDADWPDQQPPTAPL